MRNDMRLGEDALELTFDQLADGDAEANRNPHEALQTFRERRRSSPRGQETIQGLNARIVAYSLHIGAYRGLTWHDEDNGVVWLLAFRFHRSGRADDSYPHFRSLSKAELLPSASDYKRVFDQQTRTFAKALLEEVQPLVEEAKSRPNEIVEAIIGERIPIRLAYEDDSRPPTITVAITQRLLPGELGVPATWQVQLAAACLQTVTGDPKDLSICNDIAGESIRDDEMAFCDFAE